MGCCYPGIRRKFRVRYELENATHTSHFRYSPRDGDYGSYRLAGKSLKEIDVVAFTGDATSKSESQLPRRWSDWPQPVKLAVPGNHDEQCTFELLTGWKWRTPWSQQVEDLLFIGVETECGHEEFCGKVADTTMVDVAGLVILFHHYPCGDAGNSVSVAIERYAPGIPVLVLHGHWHPRSQQYPEWKTDAKMGHIECFRSKIISCQRDNRGVCALITWDCGHFSHETVRCDNL